jgi:four helix bundle protein
MREHTKLRAFLLADELVIMIYKISRFFPKEEMYGLTSQIRRAAVSVPSNIVEGCARTTQVEYRRFLELSYGSLKELHYQFGLASRLGYFDINNEKDCEKKIGESEKVLAALIRSMR